MPVVHKMTLGGAGLRVNPNEMRWNFKMKVADQAAVGGKVIQILGVTMSDITLRGQFSRDKSMGDRDATDAAERFRLRMRNIAARSMDDSTSAPVRLTYPPRGWDFEVYVKSITPVDLSVETFAPLWELVLFPFGEGSNKVVKGVKDLYIKRMMDGIGWKQTSYNGPMTQALVDETLGGESVEQYLGNQMGEAFAGSGDTGFGPIGGF